MTRIQNASSQIPDVIKTAVATVIKGSPQEVRNMFTSPYILVISVCRLEHIFQIKSSQRSTLLKFARECSLRGIVLVESSVLRRSAAQEAEVAFHGISNLASELVIACTNQVYLLLRLSFSMLSHIPRRLVHLNKSSRPKKYSLVSSKNARNPSKSVLMLLKRLTIL